MFLAPRQRKTTVFTRFWASASKNHSIYSVLWPGPSKNTGIYAVSCMLSEAFFGCQRHKNIVNYTIFTRGQYQKIMKNWPKTDQKTPNKDLQNASANFTLFSPTPNPQKRENPSRLKDFRGGSAAPARPRVAKAMLSNHHRTASPDLRAAAPAADPGEKKRFAGEETTYDLRGSKTLQHHGLPSQPSAHLALWWRSMAPFSLCRKMAICNNWCLIFSACLVALMSSISLRQKVPFHAFGLQTRERCVSESKAGAFCHWKENTMALKDGWARKKWPKTA